MGLPGSGVDVILTLVVFVALALAILGTTGLGLFLADLVRKARSHEGKEEAKDQEDQALRPGV